MRFKLPAAPLYLVSCYLSLSLCLALSLYLSLSLSPYAAGVAGQQMQTFAKLVQLPLPECTCLRRLGVGSAAAETHLKDGPSSKVHAFVQVRSTVSQTAVHVMFWSMQSARQKVHWNNRVAERLLGFT